MKLSTFVGGLVVAAMFMACVCLAYVAVEFLRLMPETIDHETKVPQMFPFIVVDLDEEGSLEERIGIAYWGIRDKLSQRHAKYTFLLPQSTGERDYGRTPPERFRWTVLEQTGNRQLIEVTWWTDIPFVLYLYGQYETDGRAIYPRSFTSNGFFGFLLSGVVALLVGLCIGMWLTSVGKKMANRKLRELNGEMTSQDLPFSQALGELIETQIRISKQKQTPSQS